MGGKWRELRERSWVGDGEEEGRGGEGLCALLNFP